MTGTNEVQLITFSGNPSSGTFLLGFKGEWTNPPIPILTNQVAQATAIADALCALSGVGAGNVVVTRLTGGPLWEVAFGGDLSDQDVPLLTVDYGGINRGTITVETTTEGSVGAPSSALRDMLIAEEGANEQRLQQQQAQQQQAVEDKRLLQASVPPDKRIV